MVNFCAGFGILLSVVAVILAIFGEVSQINNSMIPRHLRIVSISTQGLAEAIGAVADQGLANLTDVYSTSTEYADKLSAQHDGLRMTYEWGLWSYCASSGEIGSSRSYCTKRAFGANFQPAAVLLEDIPTKYASALNSTLPDTVFTADDYLGRFTTGANYLIFVGAVAAGLAMLIAFIAHRFAFVLCTLLSILSALSLAIGLVIHTVIYSRVIAAINDATVSSGVNIGITITYGNALWILWASAAAMLLSILPFAIACCTGRKDTL